MGGEGDGQRWSTWRSGDRPGAAEAYARYLPLMVFEGQSGVGLAIGEEILRRRGFTDCAAVRHPGPSIDQGIVDDLEETLSLLDIRRRFDTHRAAVRPSSHHNRRRTND